MKVTSTFGSSTADQNQELQLRELQDTPHGINGKLLRSIRNIISEKIFDRQMVAQLRAQESGKRVRGEQTPQKARITTSARLRIVSASRDLVTIEELEDQARPDWRRDRSTAQKEKRQCENHHIYSIGAKVVQISDFVLPAILAVRSALVGLLVLGAAPRNF